MCGAHPAAADLSALHAEKREVNSLDWALMRAENDIREGIALHLATPGLDKWRLSPTLTLIEYRDSLIQVKYSVEARDFHNFSEEVKRAQFEKLAAFTLAAVKTHVPAATRTDLLIIFNFKGRVAGRLAQGTLTIPDSY
jgi:hypothetical protein